MIIRSRLTDEEYETRDTVRIFNQKQYTRFLSYGAKFIDYGCEIDGTQESFYLRFYRKDVQDLLDKWDKHELPPKFSFDVD